MPVGDLWILLPSLFPFTLTNGVPALGRFGAILGIVAAVGVLLLMRGLLVLWRRAFPGKTIHQLIAWYAQADCYRPGRDRRTFRIRR